MSRFEPIVRRLSANSRSRSRVFSTRRSHTRRRPRLEYLEDRTLLSLAGASNDQILHAYGQIPLSFQVNQGQTAAQVDFLSQGSGYTLFLTPTETVLSLRKPAPAAGGAVQVADGVSLRTTFVGANPQPQVVGLDRLAGTSNYFVGSDPSQWHTNIASYGQVEYQNLYPGVDLVYHGNQRQLEYDFVVEPGANPGVIKLAISGAESMTINSQGDLVLHTSGGDVLEHAPVAYQESAGVRQPVSGQFVLEGDGQVGFALGAYDDTRPLVIDPVLSYSTYLGGTGIDAGIGIAVDTAGNAYVTGYTGSIDFPTTAGEFQGTYGGNYDAFVTKLNAAGNALVYSTYLGGVGDDSGLGIAVDTAGNAYVTGFTTFINFPTTPGAFQTASKGYTYAAFVTKLNPMGTGLVYSTYLGGTGSETAYAIAVDTAGNAYVTGDTQSTNFPTTAGAFQTTYAGESDAFVSKLNPTGTALVYSTYLGGTSGEIAHAIAVDAAGNAYVTGYTLSSDFPTTPGSFQTTFGGGYVDAFVTKLNPTGTALVYSTYLGGAGEDQGHGIAVDTSGNAYVTGLAGSVNFPTTPGANQTTYGGGYDAFVSKLNPTGTALVYSTYLGGMGSDWGFCIAVDAAGNAYVTGFTESTGFPTTAGAIQTTYAGDSDAFVSKLNPTGTALVYSTYLGGTGTEYGDGIAVDSAGNAYVTGHTGSTSFRTTPGSYQTTYGGGGDDAFVAKFDLSVQTTIALTTSAIPSAYGDWVTFTATVTAQGGPVTSGTVDFMEGNTVFASLVPLSASGTASFSISSLSAITHTITASYSGASPLDPSSGSVQQIVNQNTSLVVNTVADDPSGPTYGYTTLRDAITLANAGTPDQYVITFSVTGTIDLTSSLPGLKHNVVLEGPGASVLTVQRNASALPFSIFTVNSGATVSLSGMTITGGNAVYGGGIDNFGVLTVSNSILSKNLAATGGGIFNEDGATLTVNNNIFIGNSAIAEVSGIINYNGEGGGILNSSTLTVTDSTFTDNSSTGDGGGVTNSGWATVTDSVFSNNSAVNGGGISTWGNGTLTVTDSIFTGNSATYGGGIFSMAALTVTGSIFANDSATSGGGIFSWSGMPSIVINSLFTNNSGGEGGAIFNFCHPRPALFTVKNSIFTGNSATYGGGIFNDHDVTMMVIDSTFTDNSAYIGGGMVNESGATAKVTNCTVSGNTSQGAGGGIWGDLTLNNTIVAGNISTGTSDNDIFGQVQSTSANNLIGDGSGISDLTDLEQPARGNLIGTGAEPLNPLLGPLADNGGPTMTMALLPGSPAIDAGSNALAVDANGNPLTTDQRGAGFPRFLGHNVDIGAYEFSPLSQTIGFGPLADQTYGVAPITLNAMDTSGLPVSYMVVSGPATLSGSVLMVTGAGFVVVEASQMGNATYSAAVSVDESFTVSPATLTITPDAGQSMVYGSAVPALTYTPSGLVNGDPTLLLTGALGTTATSTSGVGNYPFTLGSLIAGTNYALELSANPPTFSVTLDFTTMMLASSANPSVLRQSVAFAVTVIAAAPGSGTPTGTVQFSIDGCKFGSAIALAGGTATSGSISTLKLGNYTITASYSGDANFTTSTAPCFTQVVNKDNTTSNLVVTVNPSVYGQSISFTAIVAAVAPGTGTPTGSVTFSDGTTTLKTVTLTAGAATYKSDKLATGPHSITATYTGNATLATSTSDPLNQTVDQDGTTTVVTASSNPSVFGQSVTFTADVKAASPGSGTPTGSVTFMDGPITLGNGTLNGSGLAKVSTKTLTVGSHAITVVYDGDTNFLTSTSDPLNQAVNQDGTSTGIVSSVNPSVYGQQVNFTATVSAAAPGSGTPGGSVTFMDGTTALGSVILSSGKASFKSRALDVGSRVITAVYGGNDNFITSTSAILTQTINQDATTTKVTSSANPSVFEQSVTFMATVKAASPGSGTPDGTVTFYDGGTAIGTGTLELSDPATAAFITTSLSIGAHAITAVYGGDPNFIISTSTAINQGVNQAGSLTTVLSSANPSTAGQSVTLTATATAVAPGCGMPTGTITFKDGATTIGAGTLDGTGTASFTTNFLSVGSHSIKVVYSGDVNYKTSTSAVLKQVVQTTPSAVPAGSAVQPAAQALGTLQFDTPNNLFVHDLALEQLASRSRRLRWVVKS